MITVQARATLRACMPPNGQALLHELPTVRPRTPLAGERGIDCNHSLPGSYRLESKDGQEHAPPRIRDALGEMVVLDHVSDPQIFMIDHIVGLDKRGGLLVVEIAPLAGDVLLRLGQQRDGFAAPAAAFRASCDSPLAAAQIRLRLAVVAGSEARLPAGPKAPIACGGPVPARPRVRILLYPLQFDHSNGFAGDAPRLARQALNPREFRHTSRVVTKSGPWQMSCARCRSSFRAIPLCPTSCHSVRVWQLGVPLP
jgi:hypothetical protein